MSKRTKLKLRRIRMSLTKYVFNSKYIVRNTLALTVVMSIIVMVMGIATVVGDRDVNDRDMLKGADATEIAEVTEDSEISAASIDLAATPYMDANSISILKGVYDVDSKSAVEAKSPEMVTEGVNPFEHKFIAISDGVNIRRQASTDSDVVGALYTNDIGDVISIEGEWLYISIGDVTGYVRSDFVLTGVDIESYIAQNGLDADELLAKPYQAADASAEDDSQTSEQQSTEDEDDFRTTEQPVTEQPATEQPTTEQPTTQEPTTEAPVTTGQPTTEQPVDNGNEVDVPITNRGPITISDSDLNLMASIMTLECGGESYEGQLAVANVILNRLQSGSWGSTISDVVYASGQFSTAYSTSLSYYLENGAQASCIQAAQDALSGTNNVGSYVSFRPASNVDTSSLDSYTIIGNHIFY